MSATQVILLERVDNLGEMGEVVKVRPGYARNYLLPQKKALRASKENISYYEAQKKHLESENAKSKKDAEKDAKSLENVKVPLIRQASEGGQLYGSVTARDVANAISEISGKSIHKSMVRLNGSFKTIGLFQLEIAIHPEVKVNVIINIARSEEEAQTQAKTGKALIAESESARQNREAASEENLENILEEGALAAQKEKQAEQGKQQEEEATEKEAKSKQKAAKKATKKPREKEDAVEASSEAEES